jgi:hypothetical protein
MSKTVRKWFGNRTKSADIRKKEFAWLRNERKWAKQRGLVIPQGACL